MTEADLFLQERKIVSVMPAAYVAKAYSYAVPGDAPLTPGTIVKIPLNNRLVMGVVWDASPDQNVKKIKEIKEIADLPPLKPSQMSFVERVADYTLNPTGAVLKMLLSIPDIFKEEGGVKAYIPTISPQEVSNALHRDIILSLQKTAPQTAAQLIKSAGCSGGVLTTMQKRGYIKQVMLSAPSPCAAPDGTTASAGLNPEQHVAADALIHGIRAANFDTFLLDGVTGSGKTEVYFEAVAEALRQDKQVLILLPEIALSNVFISRFEARFGCPPALWHSALTPAQRRNTWRGVIRGETKVIVGARSALFLPFPALGLIIVDEEHDPAFKQEEQVLYHARDMAVLKAHLDNIPICLVSATPSLETMQNCWNGKYKHLSIPGRYDEALMPNIHIVDMREHKPQAQHFISLRLKDSLQATLDKHQQSLLFLNRRGYAPLTLCRACGHRLECPNCSAWLIEHRNRKIILCHHCDYHAPYPDECPACHVPHSLAPCGPGVERIEEEAKEYFPEARIEVLASDLTQHPAQLTETLRRIRDHEIDIIIGTQIIAKGHHFPKLTCVGVIDADLGLAGGDLRATERTYQLLNQVSGRAGREAKSDDEAGEVFIQTWMPDNTVIQALASGKRDPFLRAELAARERANMPPFTRLVAFIVSGVNETQTLDTARLIAQTAPVAEGLQLLGPAPAPLFRLRNKYRYRLLLISEKTLHIQKTVRHWLQDLKVPSAVHIQVDIDPQSFL